MSEGRRVVAEEAILSGEAIGQNEIERIRLEANDAALESLVRQHSHLIYRVAYAVLRRHHDAEDATQETFVRVLRYRSKLDEVEDPKTWLARIAWRVAIDRTKKQAWRREVQMEDPEKPLPEVASAEPPADDRLQGVQVSAVLERLIAALPENLRQPLILSTIEEMSPREIGATLGINEAAVRSRVFRARQILKEKLTGQVNRQVSHGR